MNLHTDIKFFSDTLKATSQHLNISLEFIEKDYWITLVLKRLSESDFVNDAVFKGGASLSKGYELINRFSEDVDIAIINEDNKSGNKIKTIIRSLEKMMTTDLVELQMDGITSKGSMFRKSVFEYLSIDSKNKNNKLIVEINAFANPFPFQSLSIKSMVYEFLAETNNNKYIDQYQLHPFNISVLSKEQTLIEKLVSLIRVSYEENPISGISNKIRHFYDLYFLMKDDNCKVFINSETFKTQFFSLLEHDKLLFDAPKGWQLKELKDSVLVSDFENAWEQIKSTYTSELSALAYTAIPNEKDISNSFIQLRNLVV